MGIYARHLCLVAWAICRLYKTRFIWIFLLCGNSGASFCAVRLNVRRGERVPWESAARLQLPSDSPHCVLAAQQLLWTKYYYYTHLSKNVWNHWLCFYARSGLALMIRNTIRLTFDYAVIIPYVVTLGGSWWKWIYYFGTSLKVHSLGFLVVIIS